MTNDEAHDPLDPATPDAAYRPFRPFLEWAGCPLDLNERSRLLTRLNDLRVAAPIGRYSMAVELVRRAAAVETGAIENLYSTDMGFTMAVARQAAAINLEAARTGLPRPGASVPES